MYLDEEMGEKYRKKCKMIEDLNDDQYKQIMIIVNTVANLPDNLKQQTFMKMLPNFD